MTDFLLPLAVERGNTHKFTNIIDAEGNQIARILSRVPGDIEYRERVARRICTKLNGCKPHRVRLIDLAEGEHHEP